MSSMNQGLRRVGIVGLSTIVATTAMTGLAATTYAAAGDYSAASVLNVAQGQSAAPAGALSLEFANDWAANASQTFTVGSNDCSSPAGIASAVEFAALPTVVVSDPGVANVGGTSPSLSPGVLGSSSPDCLTAGIQDKVTLTQVAVSTGVATDTYKVDLSVITYNVGSTTATGNLSVATAGSFKASGSVVNAAVPDASFTNTALSAALPLATAVSLGTQTFSESMAGAFFAAGSTTTVVLTPSAGTFTAGVTPTVTVPTDYSSTNPVTTSAGTYSFTVTGPATPIAARVTVSGLTIAAPGTAQTVTLDALVGGTNVDALPVVNVVTYNARTGGATRYETAAALFDSEFRGSPDVVLSSGAVFPDALSANYLAGALGTGILLTQPNTLSTAARQSIISSHVDTVYITGGPTAVGLAVENQVKAIHVGNASTAPFVKVVRFGGADRYATNRKINETVFAPGGPPTVLLASGNNYPDGLALGPVAYQGFPLILTEGTTLGASENAQLTEFGPTNVIIAGGTLVISPGIEASLKAKGHKVLRLAGAERTLTAAAIATWATVGVAGATAGSFDAAQGAVSDTTYISMGNNFADALAAGPVAGINGRMILMSSTPTAVGAGITSYLGTKTVGVSTSSPTQVGTLHALGQTGAVSAELMKAAAATIGR